MDFEINSVDSLAVSDLEISELLSRVYVDGGFTDPEKSLSLFEPSAVRKRGKLICARQKDSQVFAGMVIIVYPDSPARVFAQDNETEMHLLGVKPEFQGKGLGRLLVTAAIEEAKQEGYSKMLLWTQTAMHSAHRLYESSGFIRIPDRDFIRANRNFLFYEKNLNL